MHWFKKSSRSQEHEEKPSPDSPCPARTRRGRRIFHLLLAVACLAALYHFALSSFMIRRFVLPAVSEMTGYSISAEDVKVSLFRMSGGCVRIRQLTAKDAEGQIALECRKITANVHLQELLFHRRVFLDRVEIADASLVFSGPLKDSPRTENPAFPENFFLGSVRIRSFRLRCEIADGAPWTIHLRDLTADGFVPGRPGELNALLDFSGAAPHVYLDSFPIHVQASYEMGAGLIPREIR